MMVLTKIGEVTMKIIENSVIIMLLLLNFTPLDAQSGAEDVEYLDLFEYQDPTFVMGSGDNAIEIHRVMRPCGKNKGHLQPLIPAEGVTLVGERNVTCAQ